jgi:hypothetical protein
MNEIRKEMGASGNISAKRLRQLFNQLEEMGKNGALAGAEQILVEVDKEYALLSARMNEIRKEMS